MPISVRYITEIYRKAYIFKQLDKENKFSQNTKNPYT